LFVGSTKFEGAEVGTLANMTHNSPPAHASAKSSHRHTRSGVPLDETPLKKGWVARESGVVNHLLNKRFAALYPSTFVTYRKEFDESPSKMWPVTREVGVTPVELGEYHLRHAGTSTLWALARGAYDNKRMWGFTITWTGLVNGQEKLSLAFETEDTAQEWHASFCKAIADSPAARVPSVHRTVSAASDTSMAASVDSEAALAMAVAPRSPGNQMPSVPAAATPPAVHALPRRQPSEGHRHRGWSSVLHINGISVYAEEQDEDGEGGAIMVSAVVRAPPMDVFKSLVQVRRSEGLGIFAGARTVEMIDGQTHVVTQRWSAAGILGGLCAPREVVLLRTWRKDEDGTYIVLYQSTTHRSVRHENGWGWKRPVRAQVQAAGFTIAPLLPQYTGGGESQESLVTLVLKADLRGLLSTSTLTGRLLAPLATPMVRGLLEPVVTSIVVLRDQVEQNRFVVRPFATSAGEESAGVMETKEQQAGAAQQRDMARTTTMLLFRDRQPLAKAQQLAVPEHPAAASLKLEPGAVQETIPEGEVVDAAGTGVEQAAALDDSWAITGTCASKYWSSPGSCGFKVRGANYLVDKKKIPAAPPMLELVAVDLLELDEPMYHVCRHLPSVRHSPAPFLFCVQLMVPSSPPVSLVCVWAAPMPIVGQTAEALIAQYEQEQQGPCPNHVAAFFRAFTEFVRDDGPEADKVRNAKFKLIPQISRGSWIIKQSVGTTPVLLGTKLTTKYFRGANYFEADVDIGASSVAASITNLVCGATKSLALDMGVLVEGQTPQHLPEQLLGTIRLNSLDLKTAAYLDEATGTVVQPEYFNRQGA
jgi:hypothetical protein